MTALADQNGTFLLKLLPSDGKGSARTTGTVKRLRGFDTISQPLRALPLNVGLGCSLRETVVVARVPTRPGRAKGQSNAADPRPAVSAPMSDPPRSMRFEAPQVRPFRTQPLEMLPISGAFGFMAMAHGLETKGASYE